MSELYVKMSDVDNLIIAAIEESGLEQDPDMDGIYKALEELRTMVIDLSYEIVEEPKI